ncbi:MAG TPA: ribose-phosphate pyrophosphokinase [Clostridiales bacterium]|nr:ribose-phosphate pyrophosphokinase [Clostridiales bacterium]
MFKLNGVPVQIERYPDETPRLNITVDSDDIMLEWLWEKDEEMILYFITRHLREQYAVKSLTLYMPYIPHARMDRVKNRKEVFTLKYFCEFINSMHFDKLIVRDAHSSVSLALLNNVVSEPVDKNIKKLITRLLDPQKDIVFYPDEGSCKRYSEMIGFPCAFGVKKRNWDTGKILGLDVHGELPASPFNVLMIDDISSYGGTFLHSARKLKELGAGRLYLYITHCENSILKGELINSGLFEKIYTTESIYKGDHPLIEVIGGKDDE